jgi:hypothetical protein
MKKIVAFSIIISLIACQNQERNCKDFKNGTFKFEFEVDGKKQTTVFQRNDSLEIETFQGKTDTSNLRWVNDCEYILTKKNPKTFQEKKSISMRILSTSKNEYTFEFEIVGSSKKQIGIATKIK